MNGLNTVVCCDYKELLKDIEDKSIDLLITDPRKMNFTKGGKSGVAKNTDFRKVNLNWDSETLKEEDIQELLRVSKNQIIFGANHFSHLLPPSRCWYVWDKKTEHKYSSDFVADCELIYTSFNKPARVIRCLWPVIRRLVETFSKPGDIILDPFAGSGSTLIAAKELGRFYIGCDLEQQYVDVAKERLAAVPALTESVCLCA